MLTFGDDDIKILPSNCFVRFKQTIVSTQSSTLGCVNARLTSALGYKLLEKRTEIYYNEY